MHGIVNLNFLFQIGFYKDKSGSDSYDTLGYYTFELLRSTRLVADTGIHRFKWSREKVHRKKSLYNIIIWHLFALQLGI